MELQRIGSTETPPATVFYWDTDNHATVELTDLGGSHILVRASKAYHLLKQDEQGWQNWDRNIGKLNTYLKEKFPQFRLSIDYANRVSPTVLDTREKAEQLGQQAVELATEKNRLEQEIGSLQEQKQHSLDEFEHVLDEELNQYLTRKQSVSQRLEDVEEQLERAVAEQEAWTQNGASAVILFQFWTDPEICRVEDLRSVVENHLGEVYDYHRLSVKQKLRGENYKLKVADVEAPRLFNRFEHTGLLNPSSIDQLTDQHPHLKPVLEKLQTQHSHVYEAYAGTDIHHKGLQQNQENTPAHAVKTILSNLDKEQFTKNHGNIPQTGPLLGVTPDTNQIVGYDPADQPHYMVNGETGSGKSVLKRVLIENCISQGYNVLSINPTDTESLSVRLPADPATFNYHSNINIDPDTATGLDADLYYPGSPHLYDTPNDFNELLDGLNFVSLKELNETQTEQFVTQTFDAVSQLPVQDTDLFVFLEEAHEFSTGDVAKAIQNSILQDRKKGIHLVLVTQHPMHFKRDYKDIRENTTGNFFLRGQYTDYASMYGCGDDVPNMPTGQAIFVGQDVEKTVFNVRPALSHTSSPTPGELEQLDTELVKTGVVVPPDLSHAAATGSTDETGEDTSVSAETREKPAVVATELDDDDKQLIEFIQEYEEREGERPNMSTLRDEGPFGSSKTRTRLSELVKTGVVVEDTEIRNYNESKVYTVKQ